MPNRADHSVKRPRPVRSGAVKVWAVNGGLFIALIGALTVILAGGTGGLWLGLGVLTTIIFLQIFLRSQRLETPVQTMTASAAGQDEPEFNDAPVLILNLSPLGRIRSLFGRTDLLPNVRIGGEFEQTVAQAEAVSVLRAPTVEGAWVIVVPEALNRDPAWSDDRTNFFAGLGHDLKSPLNAVIGFSEIMDSELRGPMPEAYKDYPGLIRESGQTLLRLVEDMLAYAKSEAGTYELELSRVDIAACGQSVLRQSQAMADKAEVTLKFVGDDDVIAMADADAIRRMWDNLVSNAIKYSPPGETVTMTARMRGAKSILQVSDQGAGMDAEDLARIAKPFAQGRNAKGRAGTGLGLAMVQRLAELQQGQVEIRTAPDAGTTVTVRLPSATETIKRAAE